MYILTSRSSRSRSNQPLKLVLEINQPRPAAVARFETIRRCIIHRMMPEESLRVHPYSRYPRELDC